MPQQHCHYKYVIIVVLFSMCSCCGIFVVNGVPVQELTKILTQCKWSQGLSKCLKLQALSVLQRALNISTINLIEGISIVQIDSNDTSSRRFDLKPSNQNLDEVLLNGIAQFLNSRKLQITVPEVGEEEARKKKGKHHHHGALMWALAIKGSFLAMAYKGIAIMAGTALIVGKMALILSAILGLKKLVSHGKEKTTFEIVKHPKYSDAHSHSASYQDDDGFYH